VTRTVWLGMGWMVEVGSSSTTGSSEAALQAARIMSIKQLRKTSFFIGIIFVQENHPPIVSHSAILGRERIVNVRFVLIR
jgi:hypothetical protein